MLFDSLLQAEVEANQAAVLPYTSPGMIPVLQATVTMNEATTYPLPTTDEWREAAVADHGLALIMKTRADEAILSKAQLLDNGYYNEWKNDRLEVEHGIFFEPGDLVIVKKQVQSRAAAGVAAKLVFKSRGPY
jgi:hypothetical protein